MGPSVKFVLAIIDSISKKNRGNFFIRKKTIPGGGVRGGVWQKTIRNTNFFFGTLPLVLERLVTLKINTLDARTIDNSFIDFRKG